jgi:DNA invertase Pin-like site-specific DNA recombinase
MDTHSIHFHEKGQVMYMKRVYCLYRVSTKAQVDINGNDIPMQKQACQEYVAKNPDWKIIKEFSEKGVSGFKVSAKDRDVIQELQKEAIEENFDILLVFMFDRIGRREDETPFVVEWFVQHGVEVWSVNEGQQRFDTHVDKLLNYIRYWQASGESIKTSIRTKTRMGQIVLDGHFKGGTAPYGYKLERLGRVNKKGHEVYDLVIDDVEAAVVRLIFDRHSNAGMGPQSISAYLTKEGIFNRNGRSFVSPSVRNYLRNPMYRGILRSGESISEPFEHLRIIDDDTFMRTQEIIRQRSAQYQERQRVPKRIATSCMLTGNIYCGHCGARLITSTAGKKRIRKDGTINERRYWRYLCYNYMRHRDECCGQSGYMAKRIDDIVVDAVRDLLKSLKAVPLSAVVNKRHQAEIKDLQSKLTAAKNTLAKATENLGALKSEVVKSIQGESSFDQELLNEMISLAERERNVADETVRQFSDAMQHSENLIDEYKSQHERFISWADIFDDCEDAVRKMIVSQLVEKVVVLRGYEVRIELSISMQQYQQFTKKDFSIVT